MHYLVPSLSRVRAGFGSIKSAQHLVVPVSYFALPVRVPFAVYPQRVVLRLFIRQSIHKFFDSGRWIDARGIEPTTPLRDKTLRSLLKAAQGKKLPAVSFLRDTHSKEVAPLCCRGTRAEMAFVRAKSQYEFRFNWPS
jgi:hypothetical protein